MDSWECRETALKLSPFSADVDDEPPDTFVQRGYHSAHWVTHLPPFAMEDHHRRRDRCKTTIPEAQFDCMFLGTTANQNSASCTLMRMAVVGQRGVIEHVIATVVNFLDDLGYK